MLIALTVGTLAHSVVTTGKVVWGPIQFTVIGMAVAALLILVGFVLRRIPIRRNERRSRED
jgi:hypothetical protein